jgi:hypothetical protein
MGIYLPHDKMALTDELLSESGQLIIPSQKRPTRMIGKLDGYHGITGKKFFTGFNDIILPGATYVIEKFFNKRDTFGQTTLSQDLLVNNGPTPTQDNLKDDFVFGFVLGSGGAGASDLIKAVKFKDKTVDTIMPIRVVPISADLSVLDQAKYAMKKTVGSKYYYYAKRFDTDIVIRHLFTDGTEIPTNIDQTETNLGLLVYGEAILNISASDLREYYIEQFGSIDNCRFNSISLVAGFLSGGDVAGVRSTTKINTPNMFMRSVEDAYKFTYKIYAI